MKTRLSMLATLVLAGCLPPGNECRIDGTGADPADVVRQALTIYHHATTKLDNGRADCILANATEILQTQDGADDVACAVRLARRGNVTEFSA